MASDDKTKPERSDQPHYPEKKVSDTLKPRRPEPRRPEPQPSKEPQPNKEKGDGGSSQ